MSDEIGAACVLVAADEIISRITPLPPIGRFPGWEPLKDATIDQKHKEGLGKDGDPRTILYATGEMAESIEYTARAGKIFIGTNDEKAEFHEYGTSRMAPRPFLGPAIIKTLPRLMPRSERLLWHTLNGDPLRW